MTDAVVAVIVLVPLAITFLLKSNAALAYLSLCASFVLITFASADIKDLTKSLSFQLNASTLNLIILILPVTLTLLLTRKTFSGSIKLVLHSVAALCAGALLALVSIPLLSLSTRQNFADSWGWINLQKIQTPVIAAGVILSLLLIWSAKHPHAKKHK
jgi:hypothetical protein